MGVSKAHMMRHILSLMLGLLLILPSLAGPADCAQPLPEAQMTMPGMANHHGDSTGHDMVKGHECVWCMAVAPDVAAVADRALVVRPPLLVSGASQLTGLALSPEPPPPRA